MEHLILFTNFCNAIEDDPRISSTHISLYLALLQQWHHSGEVTPFIIERNKIMKTAKISARGTYNKYINSLQEYGYIIYTPSHNPSVGSTVYLNNYNKNRENEKADYGK